MIAFKLPAIIFAPVFEVGGISSALSTAEDLSSASFGSEPLETPSAADRFTERGVFRPPTNFPCLNAASIGAIFLIEVTGREFFAAVQANHDKSSTKTG